jgi:hypothetical protein
VKCEDRDWSQRLQKAKTWSGNDVGVRLCNLKTPIKGGDSGYQKVWHWVEIRNHRSYPVVGDIISTIGPKALPGARFVADTDVTVTDDWCDYQLPVSKAKKGWMPWKKVHVEKHGFVVLEATGNGGTEEVQVNIEVDLINGRPPVPFRTLKILIDT